MNAPGKVVNITRKEKEYQGMLEYKEGDESRLLKNMVTGIFNLFCQNNHFLNLMQRFLIFRTQYFGVLLYMF